MHPFTSHTSPTAVASELDDRRHVVPFFSHGVGEWLQMRLMPYAVGIAASLVIVFALAGSLPLLRAKPAQALREL